MTPIPFSECRLSSWYTPILLITSYFSLDYLLKMFVIYSMDQETINLYENYQGLNNTVFKTMSVQELFDLRHEMLDLMNKLNELLKE